MDLRIRLQSAFHRMGQDENLDKDPKWAPSGLKWGQVELVLTTPLHLQCPPVLDLEVSKW
jgi:hypothetical protein